MTYSTKDSVQYDILMRVPEDWEDNTVVLFMAPPTAPDRYPAKILVTRHKRPPSSDIADVGKRAVDQISKRVDAFELIVSQPSRLANRPAHLCQFHWRSPHGRVTQQQLYVPGRYNTVLCITTAALTEEYASFAPVFDQILASIRLPADG